MRDTVYSPVTEPLRTSAPGPVRAFLRVLPAVAGSGLLVWRVGAAWTWAVLGATSLLLVGVLVAAPVARVVVRVTTHLETALVRAVSWLLLAVVFWCVFVPGRLVLRLAGDSRFGHRNNAASYWLERGKRPRGGGFEHPY